MDYNHKLEALDLIYKNREILFDKYSDHVSREHKANKWKEITDVLKKKGIYNRDWKYLRDTLWQNWRKRTVNKINRPSGSDGPKYNKLEELVLKIVNDVSSPNQSNAESSCVPRPSGLNVGIPVSKPGRCRTKILTANKETQTQSQPSSKDHVSESQDISSELVKEKLEVYKRKKRKLDLEICILESQLNVTSQSASIKFVRTKETCTTSASPLPNDISSMSIDISRISNDLSHVSDQISSISNDIASISNDLSLMSNEIPQKCNIIPATPNDLVDIDRDVIFHNIAIVRPRPSVSLFSASPSEKHT